MTRNSEADASVIARVNEALDLGPHDSLDHGSIEVLASARWIGWMSALMLGLALVAWIVVAFGLAGGWKGTGGAVYTASGVALTIALGGQAGVRAVAPKLSADARGVALGLTGALLFAGAMFVALMATPLL